MLLKASWCANVLSMEEVALCLPSPLRRYITPYSNGASLNLSLHYRRRYLGRVYPTTSAKAVVAKAGGPLGQRFLRSGSTVCQMLTAVSASFFAALPSETA